MVPLAKIPTEEYFLQQLEDPHADFTSAADALPNITKAALASASSLAADVSGTFLQRNSSGTRQASASSLVDVSGTFPRHDNETVSQTRRQDSSLDFPAYVVAIVAVVFLIMTTTFICFLCRCIARKRKRESRLADLTPAKSPIAGRLAGVRADQPIEFVVPTTVVVSETTEDSVSETDYSSSGGARCFSERRSRKRNSGFQINPEDLQHGLYVGVSEVSAQDRGGNFLGHLGKVGFSLRYNLQRSQLTVRIIGARDLRTSASPCAKVVLLPDRTTKYVTRVVRNTACPTFDECFSFCVRRDELRDKRLRISVWDYDRFSRKCLIGQVVYSVKDSGLTDTLSVEAASGEIWAELKQDTLTQHSENGEVLLSLCYDPDSSMLTLTVLKTRGLSVQHQDKGKDTSIYAKVTLYVRGKLVRTKKTPSRKRAPAVEFGTPFSIHVPQGALREVDLTVALCEKWPLGKRVLGRTQAGTHCMSEQGLQHWHDMLASPKSTCAQWHVLHA